MASTDSSTTTLIFKLTFVPYHSHEVVHFVLTSTSPEGLFEKLSKKLLDDHRVQLANVNWIDTEAGDRHPIRNPEELTEAMLRSNGYIRIVQVHEAAPTGGSGSDGEVVTVIIDHISESSSSSSSSSDSDSDGEAEMQQAKKAKKHRRQVRRDRGKGRRRPSYERSRSHSRSHSRGPYRSRTHSRDHRTRSFFRSPSHPAPRDCSPFAGRRRGFCDPFCSPERVGRSRRSASLPLQNCERGFGRPTSGNFGPRAFVTPFGIRSHGSERIHKKLRKLDKIQKLREIHHHRAHSPSGHHDKRHEKCHGRWMKLQRKMAKHGFEDPRFGWNRFGGGFGRFRGGMGPQPGFDSRHANAFGSRRRGFGGMGAYPGDTASQQMKKLDEKMAEHGFGGPGFGFDGFGPAGVPPRPFAPGAFPAVPGGHPPPPPHFGLGSFGAYPYCRRHHFGHRDNFVGQHHRQWDGHFGGGFGGPM